MIRPFTIALVLITTCILTGQEADGIGISPQSVRSTYNSMRYRAVIEMVQGELENNPSQSRENLKIYLKYLAMALFSEEGESAARGALISLLLVDPGFKFSVNEASPKIIALLENIRNSEIESAGDTQAVGKYIIVEDTRSSELLSGLLYPGWGQLKRDQKRGYLYSALFGLSVGGGLYYTHLTSVNHGKYSEAYSQPVIDEAYADYNLSYKTRNNLILSAVLVYFVSIADLLITSR